MELIGRAGGNCYSNANRHLAIREAPKQNAYVICLDVAGGGIDGVAICLLPSLRSQLTLEPISNSPIRATPVELLNLGEQISI